jgi:hypothetical protein
MSSAGSRPRVGDDAVAPAREQYGVEQILPAFRHELPTDDVSLAEADRLFSESVAHGLFSESEVAVSFEQLMEQEASAEDEPPSPPEVPSVGACVQNYRARRGQSVAAAAREAGLSATALIALEQDGRAFDMDVPSEMVTAVAARAGATPACVRTFLQRVRVTLNIASASGPALLAARRVPRP